MINQEQTKKNTTSYHREMHSSIVAIKMSMMKLMKVISTARKLKAIVPQPCTDCTVHKTSQRNSRMSSKQHRNQSGRVVQCTFDRMHVCSRESCGIVAFVMKRVNVPTQKLSNIGNTLFSTDASNDEWPVVISRPRSISELRFYISFTIRSASNI